MRQKMYRCLSIIMMCLIMIMYMPLSVMTAQHMDVDKKGSISITLKDKGTGENLGGSFVAYRVASALSSNGLQQFVYTSEFDTCGISLEDLKDENLADHLAAYAKGKELTGVTAKANDAGVVVFSEMAAGLYLLVQQGTVSGYYATAPFIIALPMTNAEGTAWIYDIEAQPKTIPTPKVEAEPLDDLELKVEKIWLDNESKARPQSVRVTLCKDNNRHETVTLNEANNWTYHWDGLGKSHRWTVVEDEVPTGYGVTYEVSDEKVLVINRSGSYVTQKPTLHPAQTGQLQWPIPILSAAGLVLFMTGWILVFAKRKKSHAD